MPAASSSTVLAPSPSSRRRVLQWLRSRRGRLALLLMFVLLAGSVYWYNEHRKISWQETLSPAYWLRRWRHEDLVDAQAAMLMHGNRALPEVALTFDDGP